MTRSRGTPTAGEERFAAVTAGLRARPGVEEGRMLRAPGLKINGKFFAFMGADDRLIVKLPRERADALVQQGLATPVTIGARTMKEWVALPCPGGTVRSAAEEALAYVGTLT